jgi:hypothetical protein
VTIGRGTDLSPPLNYPAHAQCDVPQGLFWCVRLLLIFPQCVQAYPIVSTHSFYLSMMKYRCAPGQVLYRSVTKNTLVVLFTLGRPDFFFVFLFSMSLLSNMLMPVPRSRTSGAPVRNRITQLSCTATCGVTAGHYFLVSRATKILSWL